MKLTLTRKKTEAPGVESFIFNPAEPLTWKPGQFLHYVLHHQPTDDRGSDRWFTIASAPFEKEIMITTRLSDGKSSSFKDKLRALEIGKTIEITHVSGNFVLGDIEHEYVFIAGGIGVTPFYSMLKEADKNDVKLHVTMLYGNRDDNVIYKDDFETFAKHNPHLKIQYVVAPAQIDEDLIKQSVPDIQKPLFYVSGPEGMVESLNSTLKSINVPDEHIKLDYFPGYTGE